MHPSLRTCVDKIMTTDGSKTDNTDGQTDGQKEGQGETNITHPKLRLRGVYNSIQFFINFRLNNLSVQYVIILNSI